MIFYDFLGVTCMTSCNLFTFTYIKKWLGQATPFFILIFYVVYTNVLLVCFCICTERLDPLQRSPTKHIVPLQTKVYKSQSVHRNKKTENKKNLPGNFNFNTKMFCAE
jgi:hypothetical protein